MQMSVRDHFLSMLVFIAAGLPTLAFASDDVKQITQHDELQSWIDKNAVAVRSVDPLDEDFGDLEFLVDAIGTTQVVQLGEASHVAGNGFAAKSRLLKFLHQRMGFDVLVWEAGIYDVRLTQAGLRGPEDPLSAAQWGISRWSSYEEVKPVVEYAKASQSSTHPLEMAGYDVLFSPKSFEHFASSLRSFAAAVRNAAARKRSQDLVENALAAYNRICCTKDVRPGQREDLDNLQRVAA